MITEILLKDQTTGRNIIWANAEHGAKEITVNDVKSIEPRWKKLREHQRQRTRDRAEIFTPPNICKIQNDLIVAHKKSWTEYIDAKFLEITCGEAPYLVSRYNAVTGEDIPINQRVGILDRKLRVVSAETKTLPDWTDCAARAVQSVYGYEFQGDNLFLARQNVYLTVDEYFKEKFSRVPPADFMFFIANVISCNLWQMDGLTGSPPFQENENLFGGTNCKIIDWRERKVIEFLTLTKGAGR